MMLNHDRSHILSITELLGDRYLISGEDPISHVLWSLTVNRSAYLSWKQGTLIQVAFPELTMSERELLMTGYTQATWDQLFPAEEGDDAR